MQIEPVLLQRDVFFITIAVLALALFYALRTPAQGRLLRLRPIGRRLVDLEESEKSSHDFSPSLKHSAADVLLCSQIEISQESINEIWRIGIFSQEKIRGRESAFALSRENFFTMAETSEEVEQLIAPLIRKIIGKYREVFTRKQPISVERGVLVDSISTWFVNEAAIRSAIFEFLDDVVAIGRMCNANPSLVIIAHENFVLRVEFLRSDSVKAFAEVLRSRPGIDFRETSSNLQIDFWIAFSSSAIPYHMFSNRSAKPLIEEERSA